MSVRRWEAGGSDLTISLYSCVQRISRNVSNLSVQMYSSSQLIQSTVKQIINPSILRFAIYQIHRHVNYEFHCIPFCNLNDITGELYGALTKISTTCFTIAMYNTFFFLRDSITLATKHVTMTKIFKYMSSNNSPITLYTHKMYTQHQKQAQL